MILQTRNQFAILFLSALPMLVKADVYTATDDMLVSAGNAGDVPSMEKGSWVFAPMPVANATVGTGLQLVGLFLHPPKEGDVEGVNATTGVGSMYTDNKSWGAGIFHQNSFYADRLRVSGGIGKGSFNLKYSGNRNLPGVLENPVRYQAEGDFLFAKALLRLPGTEHLFLGASFLHVNGEISFNTGDYIDIERDFSAGVTTASLSAILQYDSRDDNYYPSSGSNLELSHSDYSDRWNSDFTYTKFSSRYSKYLPISAKTIVALNVGLQGSAGKVPFFDSPDLDIRGYGKGDLADDFTLLLRSEIRYKFKSRWGAVLFVDKGWVDNSLDELFTLEGRSGLSKGIGLRWQVAAEKSMHLGMDLAFTEIDTNLIIKIGETF